MVGIIIIGVFLATLYRGRPAVSDAKIEEKRLKEIYSPSSSSTRRRSFDGVVSSTFANRNRVRSEGDFNPRSSWLTYVLCRPES